MVALAPLLTCYQWQSSASYAINYQDISQEKHLNFDNCSRGNESVKCQIINSVNYRDKFKAIVANQSEKGAAEIEPATDESFYKSAIQSLEKKAQGCQEKKQVHRNISYSICTHNGKLVTASEALLELGDGIGYWFENGQVKAFRRFHSDELIFFGEDGKVQVMFYPDYSGNNGGKIRMVSPEEMNSQERRDNEEVAKAGYQNILKVFRLR
ncbi:hypothetical protein [Calothrix sp. 336/3]|nr:hypothetical protein IJ00_16175 [Calothrix sp. 336/3]